MTTTDNAGNGHAETLPARNEARCGVLVISKGQHLTPDERQALSGHFTFEATSDRLSVKPKNPSRILPTLNKINEIPLPVLTAPLSTTTLDSILLREDKIDIAFSPSTQRNIRDIPANDKYGLAANIIGQSTALDTAGKRLAKIARALFEATRGSTSPTDFEKHERALSWAAYLSRIPEAVASLIQREPPTTYKKIIGGLLFGGRNIEGVIKYIQPLSKTDTPDAAHLASDYLIAARFPSLISGPVRSSRNHISGQWEQSHNLNRMIALATEVADIPEPIVREARDARVNFKVYAIAVGQLTPTEYDIARPEMSMSGTLLRKINEYHAQHGINNAQKALDTFATDMQKITELKEKGRYTPNSQELQRIPVRMADVAREARNTYGAAFNAVQETPDSPMKNALRVYFSGGLKEIASAESRMNECFTRLSSAQQAAPDEEEINKLLRGLS